MSDREKIIAKIRKCLALGKSANEHEAAAALRQAAKLMAAHGVSDLDVEAAAASESRAKSSVTKAPAAWEARLVKAVGSAFGCWSIFHPGYWARRAEWGFIGCGAAPEIAQYAFAVLLRQLKSARSDYIKSALKRCKPGTKTRRGDLFATSWVMSVTETIQHFAGSEHQRAAIKAYLAVTYPDTTELSSLDRNKGKKLRGHEINDIEAGYSAGKKAELNRGIAAGDQPLALGMQ